MPVKPASTFAPGFRAGAGGRGEKSAALVYLLTESRLTPRRRAISRPETPLASSRLIFSTTVMGTVIAFLVPSRRPGWSKFWKRLRGTYPLVAGP